MTDELTEEKKNEIEQKELEEQKKKEIEQKELEEQKKKEPDEKEVELKIETEKNGSKPPIKRRADFGKPHNFKSKPKINPLVKTENQTQNKTQNKKEDNKENEDKEIDIFNNKNKSDNQTYIYIGIFIVGMIALLPIIVIFLKKDDSTNTGNNPGWKPLS